QEVAVLSLKNALGNGVDLTALQGEIDGALAVGKTVAIVLLDGIAKGALAFQDTIRENAKAVMSEMKDCGYHTIMLTGDNGRSANFIASQCNIAEVKYDLLPENKLTAIEDLQSGKHKVVMVGDGINDAPSLKIADCSFAMGAMGSDIAIDSADMAILNSDIQKVADTMRLSKRVMRTIKRNIAIAMTISAIGVILSALGLLTPVTGALVHNCTSVLVVASSALVLYSRKRKSKDSFAKID
ncbi:MAG: HAD-IC family P-type ATPase, partial [Clostridia bacterium]